MFFFADLEDVSSKTIGFEGSPGRVRHSLLEFFFADLEDAPSKTIGFEGSPGRVRHSLLGFFCRFGGCPKQNHRF